MLNSTNIRKFEHIFIEGEDIMGSLDKAAGVKVESGNVAVSGDVGVTGGTVDVGQVNSVVDTKAEMEAKDITFSNTDGAAKDVWVPASGKKVIIDDLVFSGVNRNASGYILIALQFYKGGSWHFIAGDGVNGIGTFTFSHSFTGKITSAAGDGTSPRVRVVKVEGTSTNWSVNITVTGREVD